MMYKSCSTVLKIIIVALGVVLGLRYARNPALEYHIDISKDSELLVRVLSYDPLLIHIKNFISREEAAHLVNIR